MRQTPWGPGLCLIPGWVTSSSIMPGINKCAKNGCWINEILVFSGLKTWKFKNIQDWNLYYLSSWWQNSSQDGNVGWGNTMINRVEQVSTQRLWEGAEATKEMADLFRVTEWEEFALPLRERRGEVGRGSEIPLIKSLHPSLSVKSIYHENHPLGVGCWGWVSWERDRMWHQSWCIAEQKQNMWDTEPIYKWNKSLEPKVTLRL